MAVSSVSAIGTASPAFRRLLWALWILSAIIGGIGFIERLLHGDQATDFSSYIPWGLWVAAYIYFSGLSAGAFLLAAAIYVFRIRVLEPISRLALTTCRKYGQEPSFEYGSIWRRSEGVIPKSPVGNARKCTFCVHRLEHRQLPMCVTTCIGRSTFFGDLNDPTTLVSQISVQNNAVNLKPELGTAPKVFYLL